MIDPASQFWRTTSPQHTNAVTTKVKAIVGSPKLSNAMKVPETLSAALHEVVGQWLQGRQLPYHIPGICIIRRINYVVNVIVASNEGYRNIQRVVGPSDGASNHYVNVMLLTSPTGHKYELAHSIQLSHMTASELASRRSACPREAEHWTELDALQL